MTGEPEGGEMSVDELEVYRARRHGACGRGMLRRPREERVVAGVAAAVAEAVGVEPCVVRLGFVLTTLFVGGLGLVAYLVLWAVLPEGDRAEDVLGARLERDEITGAEYREMLADITRSP